ncbi:MAG: HAD-IC family P-type ATPase [Candidatus Scalindua sp.]|jgi:magnesium-transporting ATPase (P-type)|nr:HAD-IC family P-type ATPase [Candidatus Scalindua sp.]MBT7350647.1 HAD-IC family P-type ATPase [candidate division WWE3 bacterium]
MNWYQIDSKDSFRKLSTSEIGLTDKQVRERLLQYGPNKLAEEEKIRRFRILLHQFTSPLIYILLIAAIVTFFLKEYIDSGVIMAVVLLNSVIGYIQEFKAEEGVRALKKLIVPKARVLRDGIEKEVNSLELVPGDIVLLSSGSKVPADLRLFRTIELKIEEAMLTGESIPADKIITTINEDNLTPGDQRNIAFMGTVVASGRANGVVVETGQMTVLGQIAKEVKEVSAFKTPIQDKLDRFARLIGYMVIGFCAIVFWAGIMLGAKASDMFLIAVATAVSAIPEGLPVAVTITMAIGVARMARRNAIIRKLPAVETLGSTTVIGSDKTGTLTKNEMTVRLIFDGEKTYEVTGSGYEPEGMILHEQAAVSLDERENLRQVLRIGLLCNESNVYKEDGQYKVDGDPTEAALIISASKAGLRIEDEKNNHPQIEILPFESERGYMATLHKYKEKKFVFVKGAPEMVLDMCTMRMIDNGLDKNKILHVANIFAKEGLRVLAMAYKEVPADLDEITHHDVESNMILTGLQGMLDPPRPEAVDAIRGCKEAGVRVVMITGDHATTASAISGMLGITTGETNVLTGKEIETMADDELFNTVKNYSVFARVAPQHKLRIARQLARHGEIVAVTGDGVNDAPALKAAHIGIAMGGTGTDVAREASDMVLADDNFASIFTAVEEGRVVYDNIRKVTLFLVSCGFGELIAILATIVMGIPIPYIPAQILWLNLVTNGLQDVALAFEPGERGILNKPPRKPKEGILSSLIIQRTFLMGIVLAVGTLYVFTSGLNSGVSIERARTVALTTMVFFQFYQALNCRSETESIFSMNPMSNLFLFYSMIAAFFAQLAVLYVPTFQWIFRTVPLTMTEWLQIGLVTVTVVVAVEIDKWIRRRKL